MDGRTVLPLVLVVPVAAVTAWMVARNAQPGDATADPDADLAARIERLERALGSGTSAAAPDDRTTAHRLDAIEARLAELASSSATPAKRPDQPGTAPAAEGRPAVAAGLATEPASAEHRDAVRRLSAHLVTSAGPPLSESEFAWAAGQLERETRRGRISPQEAEELAAALASLAPGHAARPPLAKAAAVGWGRDARLGPFLDRFAANAEPALHTGVLAVLDDEHPGTAFSEYVLRLAREDRDPAVLAIALDLDHIEAAATAAYAARFVQTIETRVLAGGFDEELRQTAGLAVAVASLRATEAGAASLRRLADRETEPKVAEKLRAAAASVTSGDATLKSLERLFE